MIGKQRIPAIAKGTAKNRSKLYGYDFFCAFGGEPLGLIVHKLAGVRSDTFTEMVDLMVFHRSK
jgi:hypothetical protein